MAGTKNSKPARRSSPQTARAAQKKPSSAARGDRRAWEAVVVLAVLAAWSACAVFFFYQRGWLLYYGDAEAHLNIARRILDSRTPGYGQVGTIWLPLPHLLMAPLARDAHLWQTGLAGAIPSAACFTLGGVFLFAAVRRVLNSSAAAVAATGLFALNPNLLYLQSTAMTEPVFFAALMALLYSTVCFGESRSWVALCGAGASALAGTLTRYEAWFLLPFATLFVLVVAKEKRLAKAAVFAAIAGLGPLVWLAHNWWCCGDFLAFYRAAPQAIQAAVYYPGQGDWNKAWLYFRSAVEWCAGRPLLCLGGGGLLACVLIRRVFWPLLLLLLPGVFYVWSIHSAGTPIFLPDRWPHSYYNTRYGLELFPLAVFASAGLVTLAPRRARVLAALAVVATGTATWLLHPSPDAWITWKESQTNSEARRAWTAQAAEFLGPRYRRGSGIITTFGDMTAVFRKRGIPLRETLTNDNWPLGPAAVARPDLFLWEEWAVVMGGDPAQTAVIRAGRSGLHYALARAIIVKGAPVIEIYRRDRSQSKPFSWPDSMEGRFHTRVYKEARDGE